MAIALVNKLGVVKGASSITTLTITLTAAVAAGDDIILSATWGANTGGTRTITDSKGNTYTEIVNNEDAGITAWAAIWHAPVTTALSVGDTITVHYTTGVNSLILAAYDFSGLSASPLDQTAVHAGTGSNPSTASATTTQANELLFGVLVNSSTVTPGTGFTALDSDTTWSNHHFSTEYEVVSSTGSYSAAWTGASQAYSAVLATFIGASGGTTFNDSGNGTITLGGTASEAHAWTASQAGTIFLTGSGTDSFSGSTNDVASGTIVIGGSMVDALSMVDSGAGTLTLGGSSVDGKVYLDQPLGTIHLGGAGSDIYATSWSPTATMFLTGSDYDTWIGGQIALAISLLMGDNGTLQTLRWRIVQATLDNSYPTGGYALTPQELDFTKVRLLLPIPYGGYIFQWTGNKLMAFQQSGSVGPLIEVPNGTNLSSETLNLFIIGDHI